MNQEEQAECWKVLNKMLQAKWIEPADAHSPITTPMFCVEKGWNPQTSHQLSEAK
jgi:hypothetical protein